MKISTDSLNTLKRVSTTYPSKNAYRSEVIMDMLGPDWYQLRIWTIPKRQEMCHRYDSCLWNDRPRRKAQRGDEKELKRRAEIKREKQMTDITWQALTATHLEGEWQADIWLGHEPLHSKLHVPKLWDDLCVLGCRRKTLAGEGLQSKWSWVKVGYWQRT